MANTWCMPTLLAIVLLSSARAQMEPSTARNDADGEAVGRAGAEHIALFVLGTVCIVAVLMGTWYVMLCGFKPCCQRNKLRDGSSEPNSVAGANCVAAQV